VDYSVHLFGRGGRRVVLPRKRQRRNPLLVGAPVDARDPRALGCAAFTIVEVIFGVAVVGVLVVGLFAAIAFSASSVRVGQEDQRVTQLLTEKLDTIRLYNWTQLDGDEPGYVPTNFTARIDAANTNSLTYYTGTVSIVQAPIEEAYRSNLLQVTVTVQWTAGSRPQSRSMSTYVARFGLQSYIMR
jgi:type II secretory pathway pseudopilin PulG